MRSKSGTDYKKLRRKKFGTVEYFVTILYNIIRHNCYPKKVNMSVSVRAYSTVAVSHLMLLEMYAYSAVVSASGRSAQRFFSCCREFYFFPNL